MFGDPDDDIKEEVLSLLEIYTLEQILDYNDLTVEEAITMLFLEGYIELPEIKPIN